MGENPEIAGHNMTGMGLDQSTVLFFFFFFALTFALWHDS